MKINTEKNIDPAGVRLYSMALYRGFAHLEPFTMQDSQSSALAWRGCARSRSLCSSLVTSLVKVVMVQPQQSLRALEWQRSGISDGSWLARSALNS